MGVGFQIKIFLSFFGKSRKFNVMLQAVTGNVHDVVTLWIKQKFFGFLQQILNTAKIRNQVFVCLLNFWR